MLNGDLRTLLAPRMRAKKASKSRRSRNEGIPELPQSKISAVTATGRVIFRYCRAMRIGIDPCPDGKARRALPMTAPKALAGSAAFIACPGVVEVVSRSPTSTGA